MPLDFDIIREIVSHGAQMPGEETVDPSQSERLRRAGLGMVTAHIEQLALHDIVRDPMPLFGGQGGMWIGYRLTDFGLSLSESEDELRRAVAPLTGGPRTEVSESILDLEKECRDAAIREEYREDFLTSLKELRTCFDSECFISTVMLCGKLIEVCLHELHLRHGLDLAPRATIGRLIGSIEEQLPQEYLDPSLLDVARIVNLSRNTAVHLNERIPVPSRDQAVMVIFATRDLIRRKLVHNSS